MTTTTTTTTGQARASTDLDVRHLVGRDGSRVLHAAWFSERTDGSDFVWVSRCSRMMNKDQGTDLSKVTCKTCLKNLS
jgi:hypothetical protein